MNHITAKTFNDTLHQRLEAGMKAGLADMRPQKRNRWLLAIPAAIGWFTQRWFYVCWRNFARKKRKNGVYDSVLFACMFLTYPSAAGGNRHCSGLVRGVGVVVAGDAALYCMVLQGI